MPHACLRSDSSRGPSCMRRANADTSLADGSCHILLAHPGADRLPATTHVLFAQVTCRHPRTPRCVGLVAVTNQVGARKLFELVPPHSSTILVFNRSPPSTGLLPLLARDIVSDLVDCAFACQRTGGLQNQGFSVHDNAKVGKRITSFEHVSVPSMPMESDSVSRVASLIYKTIF